MGSMRRSLCLSILVVHLICFPGCSGLMHSRKPISPTHPDEMVQGVQAHAARLRTFHGEGRITTVSTEGGFRGSLQIRSRLPDSLWIKVEGPLGIDVMTGLIGGGNAQLVYPREGLLYTGTTEALWDQDIMPVPIGSTLLVQSILGLLIPETPDGNRPAVRENEGEVVLEFNTGEIYSVDPEGPVVTRVEKRDHTGQLIWEWEARRFRKRRGVRLPLIVRMTHHYPVQRVTLFFETVRANRRLKQDWCKLRIPEGVETIEF